MKKFNPEMKVVRFGNEDVIVTSGVKTITLTGMGSGGNSDNTLSFGSYNYVYGNDKGNTSTIAQSLSDYFGDSDLNTNFSDINFFNGDADKSLNTLWTGDDSDTAGYDHTYVYDGSKHFSKQ